VNPSGMACNGFLTGNRWPHRRKKYVTSHILDERMIRETVIEEEGQNRMDSSVRDLKHLDKS